MSLRLSGGRRLQSPPGERARPTAARVRLAVMNLLAAELPGCRWLDLCCGSGLMGCEALQRGASTVLAVERDRRIAAVARANLEAVAAAAPRTEERPGPGGAAGPGVPQVSVVQQEVLRFLTSPTRSPEAERSHDLIYLDPPYASGLHAPVASAVARCGWLAPHGTLIWECSRAAVPTLPPGWLIRQQRCYGTTTLLLLQLGC